MEKFKEITREELKEWMDEKKDFALVDVLGEGSYEGRHLPGAKHADVGEEDFLKRIEGVVSDKNATVVVYCASFTCKASPRAAEKLVDAGYTNVYDFTGGLADWQDAGYPFEGDVAQEKVEAKCSCCN